MSIFYVFQGETYNEESSGGYVWSPQLNKSGRKNAGYTMMTQVKKGISFYIIQMGRSWQLALHAQIVMNLHSRLN